MNCMKDAIVLSANPYAFTDEQTGEVRRGVTVYYVSSLTPSVDENGAKGVAPTKANFNHSLFNSFKRLKIRKKWKNNFIQTDELRSLFDSYAKVKRMLKTGFSPKAK